MLFFIALKATNGVSYKRFFNKIVMEVLKLMLKYRSLFVLTLLSSFVVSAQQPYTATLTTTEPSPIFGTVSVPCETAAENPFTNCSFETGDLTGWVANDLPMPFLAIQVAGPGVSPGFGFFATAPTDGGFVVVSGFDGDGPGVIEIAQDVSLPAIAVSVDFDFRAAYDLATFGATMDREIRLEVQPTGGGAALASTLLFTAVTGDIVVDSGALTGSVDVSSFSGQSVRIAFVMDIPENLTGPAFFQLDNVSVGLGLPVPSVPALSKVGIIMIILLLSISGLLLARRQS